MEKEKKQRRKRCQQCNELKYNVCYRPNAFAQDVYNDSEAYWTVCDECDYRNKMDI